MAGDAEIEEEMIEPQVQETHIDETIYVALGVNLKKDKPNLLWVLSNFPGCQVIILHVHRTSKWIPMSNNYLFIYFSLSFISISLPFILFVLMTVQWELSFWII